MYKLAKLTKIILMLFVLIWLAGCGQMTTNEPNHVPMPKKEDMKKAKAKTETPKEKQTQKQEEVVKKAEQMPVLPEEVPNPDVVLANVEELISKMTLEEKVGQMFLARAPQTGAIEAAQKYHLGGYLLFAVDFKEKTKEQVIQMTGNYQKASKIPMWIGVDEEGGVVNRVSRNSNLRLTPFASPKKLYQDGGFDRIANDTQEKSELLHSLGINLNLAPVCDIPEKETDFIYSRAISTDPKLVEDYTVNVVKKMNEYKMASALKHFPGYGNNVDTHTDFAYDERSLESFKTRDFLPFIAGIKNGADAIMVSHNVMMKVDDKLPASLSPAVHKLLRKDLAFKGVIITDELAMEAVKKLMSDEEIAIQAVLAGNDILCTTAFESQIPAVVRAVEEGKIKPEMIDAAVRRILVWKQKFMTKEITKDNKK